MKPSLLKYLVCPEDGGPLTAEILDQEDGGEIRSGLLRSRSGRVYRIDNYVPRFTSADDYAYTFSVQRRLVRQHLGPWRRTSGTTVSLGDDATFDYFVKTTRFGEPSDGLVLDAGCGHGGFLSLADHIGPEVIGVDLSSDSVDLAFEAVGRHPRVHVVQADLAKLPFAPRIFKRIFSIGVIHHTPDPAGTFNSLVRHLAEGGEIAVWVYAPQFKKASDRFRKITTKLPLRLVYAWCLANEALFAWARSLPVGGGVIGSIIPGGTYPRPFWMRVIGDFDDLTPKFAFTFTGEQVRAWFEQAGLAEIEILPRPTSVRGKKITGNRA